MLKDFPNIENSPTVLKAYLTNLFLILKEFPELRFRSFQVLLERILEQDCILFNGIRHEKHLLKSTDVLCTTILVELHQYLDVFKMEKQKLWCFILNVIFLTCSGINLNIVSYDLNLTLYYSIKSICPLNFYFINKLTFLEIYTKNIVWR